MAQKTKFCIFQMGVQSAAISNITDTYFTHVKCKPGSTAAQETYCKQLLCPAVNSVYDLSAWWNSSKPFFVTEICL